MVKLRGQVTVRIDKRPLAALLRAMPGRTQAVVDRNAEKVADRARANAHVITGAMRASIYVSRGLGSSDYPTRRASAAVLNPKAKFTSQVNPEKSRASAVVGVAVNYGVYEEIRAGHRFLGPAAEVVRPSYYRDFQKEVFRP